MRFLFYNIRYGTGGGESCYPWSGYLRSSAQNLARIVDFIADRKPDVAGLVEVDAGSYRTGHRNQAEVIAEALGHYHCYRSKYGLRNWTNRIPVLNKQGNAFLARDSARREQFHYFEKGIKKLVIQLDLPEMSIFLVHLSLRFRTRHHQLRDLYGLVRHAEKPFVIAGDFNSLWGNHEMDLFKGAAGLNSANEHGLPTFPSWAPKRQLDFILYSKGLRVTNFAIPRVTLSDHLPLVCDIEPA